MKDYPSFVGLPWWNYPCFLYLGTSVQPPTKMPVFQNFTMCLNALFCRGGLTPRCDFVNWTFFSKLYTKIISCANLIKFFQNLTSYIIGIFWLNRAIIFNKILSIFSTSDEYFLVIFKNYTHFFKMFLVKTWMFFHVFLIRYLLHQTLFVDWCFLCRLIPHKLQLFVFHLHWLFYWLLQ